MMPIPVKLRICQSEPLDYNPKQLDGVAQALDILNKQFRNKVSFLSLTGKRRPRELDSIVSCRITNIDNFHDRKTINGLEYTSSYYVGQAIVNLPTGESIEITIEPDLEGAVRNHLLEYACGVYLPQELNGNGGNDRNGSHWLLLLMWRCAFERALRFSSIPKAYIQKNENMRCFRGRLDVAKHIKENLTDQSRFYCDYRPMSFDITINKVIRYVYKLVLNASSGIDRKAFLSLATHDERLAAFGVSNAPVLPEAIDRIKYTRMTEAYRPLMAISKTLIKHFGASDYNCSSDALSYFVDWTEVWENYLLKVMQRNIPDYVFISPNDSSEKTFLLQCGREIRPDFLVYKDGELIAVMDAKYKNYTKIGNIEDEKEGIVNRQDLYQMTTYLYCYSTTPEKRIKGIFLSRGKSENVQSSPYCNSALHGELALLNLPLPDSIGELRIREKEFAKRLSRYLNS